MYVVGVNGYIYKFGNGVWNSGRVKSHVTLKDVFVLNNLYGYTVGDKEAYKTFDGGTNWVPMLGFLVLNLIV
ncbi:MAG: hypothetical protein IPL95_07045 [Saprospiraceae bacterium]|nr:hypothetical protein [Saprospiraceae bacterium]